jgi:CCR4-NOT transcription complex subunit 7/8
MSNTLQFQDIFPKHLPNGHRLTSTNGNHIHSINDPPTIRDVWEENFEEEFSIIMNLAEKYKVIGMDTEFPGIVYRLNENDLGSIANVSEIEYKTIKMNVDKLKVIQVGLSVADEDGYLPDHVNTWQFNFKFDLDKDDYANDAIELLTNSGIKFEEHSTKGISPKHFAEYLIASGLLFNDDVKWISFHGGFDFAYLIRMLNGENLPDDESNFYNLLSIYFPAFYDVKYMAREVDTLKGGGLNKIAYDLNVRRVGPQHQAGSDSLLTLSTYFKLKGSYLKNSPEHRHANVLYGIGSSGEEGFNDYIWHNFVTPDYTPMLFNGYGMNGVSLMDPYYPQNDNIYNNHFSMSYNTAYTSYGPTSYMDSNPKFKKYEMYTGKAKN